MHPISAMITIHGGAENPSGPEPPLRLLVLLRFKWRFRRYYCWPGCGGPHNRFYQIELPQVLSFFGGTRLVPIISALVYTLVGI